MSKKKVTKKNPREPLFFIRPSEDMTNDEVVDELMAMIEGPVLGAVRSRPSSTRSKGRPRPRKSRG